MSFILFRYIKEFFLNTLLKSPCRGFRRCSDPELGTNWGEFFSYCEYSVRFAKRDPSVPVRDTSPASGGFFWANCQKTLLYLKGAPLPVQCHSIKLYLWKPGLREPQPPVIEVPHWACRNALEITDLQSGLRGLLCAKEKSQSLILKYEP
jgi:hypothetical protein